MEILAKQQTPVVKCCLYLFINLDFRNLSDVKNMADKKVKTSIVSNFN